MTDLEQMLFAPTGFRELRDIFSQNKTLTFAEISEQLINKYNYSKGCAVSVIRRALTKRLLIRPTYGIYEYNQDYYPIDTLSDADNIINTIRENLDKASRVDVTGIEAEQIKIYSNLLVSCGKLVAGEIETVDCPDFQNLSDELKERIRTAIVSSEREVRLYIDFLRMSEDDLNRIMRIFLQLRQFI